MRVALEKGGGTVPDKSPQRAGYETLQKAPRGHECVPLEAQADRGFVTTFARAPQGSSLEYTDRHHRKLEAALLELPETASVMAITGPSWTGSADVTSGIIFAELLPVALRARSQQQIVDDLLLEFAQHPGLQAFPINEPSLGINFYEPDVSLIVQGPAAATPGVAGPVESAFFSVRQGFPPFQPANSQSSPIGPLLQAPS